LWDEVFFPHCMPSQPSLKVEFGRELVRPTPQPGEPTDAELVIRLRRGDTVALDLVLRRYWPPVVAYLVRLVGTRDAAEDIAQQAFCRLWDRRASWHDAGSLRGLLYRIARNLAISDRRHLDAEARSAAGLADVARVNPTPLQLLEDKLLRREVERAISRLPERRREVFVLRCVHDLSYKEIADVMGTSTQTVANQLSHALATLRQSLGHLLGG
jgi:RNA polymerase sigma-70 factor, ECF subfamily